MPFLKRLYLLPVLATMTLAIFTSAQAVVDIADDEYLVFYHHDALGSPAAATNDKGQLLWREASMPYGKSAGKTNQGGGELVESDGAKNETRLGYTGHTLDAGSGLVYMKARFYDPYIGRFYSNDPVGFNLKNVSMFNRYAYANNNPYIFTDPTGNSPEGTNGEEDSDNDGIPDSADTDDDDSNIIELTPGNGENGLQGQLKTTAHIGVANTRIKDKRALDTVPLSAQSRVNLKKEGVAHTVAGHMDSSKKSKSQFSISLDKLKDILQSKEVVNSPASRLDANHISRQVDVGFQVGNLPANAGGKPTSVITVLTSPKGDLVSAFPGPIRY